MPMYCKAYKLKEVRQFSQWSDLADDATQSDEDLCFVWDDFTVSDNCFDKTAVLLSQVTPKWQTFCEESLHFALPDELQQPA